MRHVAADRGNYLFDVGQLDIRERNVAVCRIGEVELFADVAVITYVVEHDRVVRAALGR